VVPAPLPEFRPGKAVWGVRNGQSVEGGSGKGGAKGNKKCLPANPRKNQGGRRGGVKAQGQEGKGGARKGRHGGRKGGSGAGGPRGNGKKGGAG